MDESTNATSGGTVEQTGSQGAPSPNASGSAEGASTAPEEPVIEFEGRKLSGAEMRNALKVHDRFTQTAQEQAERERKIAERENAIREAELRNAPLQNAARLLANPDVAARVGEVVPEMQAAMPTEMAMVNQAMLAENLALRFDKFAGDNKFTEDELAGIRAESLTLANKGDLNGALDFASIGFRLYRDNLIERERQEAVAAAQAQAQAARNAQTVPPGAAQIPPRTDGKGLRGANAMSYGHAVNAKR